MKSSILLTCFIFACSVFCHGQEITAGKFKELCKVYMSATHILSEMKTSSDWPKTHEELKRLQEKSLNSTSLQEILRLTYPTC